MRRGLECGRLWRSALIVAVLSGLAGSPVLAADRPATSASVGVVIRVEPTAEATFTSGSEFVLDVPLANGHTIIPAVLSFDVRANAPVELRLGPSAFLTTSDGRLLGAASGHGGRHRNQQGTGHTSAPGGGHGNDGELRIGYVIGVLFPAPPLNKPLELLSRDESEALWAQADSDDAATATVLFEPGQDDQTASGLILVVSERNWTEDGNDAQAGSYAGAIQITVAVREQ